MDIPMTKRDEGIALITVVLMAFVMVLLASVVVTLSTHNVEQSANARSRSQAVAVAEAGIDHAFALIERSSAPPCATQDSVQSAPLESEFSVDVDYFPAGAVPEATPLPCSEDGTVVGTPTRARIVSQGSVGSASPRRMEALVDLEPKAGEGLDGAMVSQNDLVLTNAVTVEGDETSDGTIYTNGNLTIQRAITIHGSVYAQGTILLDNAGIVIDGDAWGYRDVQIAKGGPLVKGSVISSIENVTVHKNSTVQGNARAGQLLTCPPSDGRACTGGSPIAGSKTQNSPSEAPPAQTFPRITGETESWQSQYTITPPFTGTQDGLDACQRAKAYIDDWAGHPEDGDRRLVRITDECALVWENPAGQDFYEIGGDLAILTNGSVTFQREPEFKKPSGEPGKFHVIAVWPGQQPDPPDLPVGYCDGDPPPHDVTKANGVKFTNLEMFFYSPCTVSLANDSSSDPLVGQVIAGTIVQTNALLLTYKMVTTPGLGELTGYKQNILYKREIRQGQ